MEFKASIVQREGDHEGGGGIVVFDIKQIPLYNILVKINHNKSNKYIIGGRELIKEVKI